MDANNAVSYSVINTLIQGKTAKCRVATASFLVLPTPTNKN